MQMISLGLLHPLRHGLFKKQDAFKNGGGRDKREAVREVGAEIKKAKIQYKDKFEEKFSSNNLKAAW